MESPLVEAKNLVKIFPKRESILALLPRFRIRSKEKNNGALHAVDNVSITIGHNETFAVVGESGSGKTTLGMCILRLIEPTSGSLYFMGEEITDLTKGKLRRLRSAMQIVFQDPS